jgi:tetratricopeptide (TPR) repeat protein
MGALPNRATQGLLYYRVTKLLGMLAVCSGLGFVSDAVPTARAQTPAATPAATNPAPSGDLQKQYDAAFQEMLAKPADLDVLFKFASLASQTGDLEGAISALERMLLINANLPRVRLELGVLYYRLSSFEVAAEYLEGALKSPGVPADVRDRAQQFLAQIKSQQQPSHLHGELFLGLRYQSNANLGPATSSVQLFGQVANLNQSAIGTPDWGAVSTMQFRHTYDLGTQDRATMETILTAYANRQFQVSAANVSLLDLTTGPRFQILSGSFQDITVKPLIAAGAIWINDSLYYGSWGGGVEVNAMLSDRLRNVTTAIWRRHDNQDTAYLPTNSLFRGTEYSFNTVFPFEITQIISLFGSGSASRYLSDLAPWQSYQLWGVGGGMSFHFTDPALRTGLPWTVSVSAGNQWWRYDAPDSTVNPTVFRDQSDFLLNLTLAIPFDDRTTFTASGGRFVRSATLPNYAFDNNNVMFGVSWRF